MKKPLVVFIILTALIFFGTVVFTSVNAMGFLNPDHDQYNTYYNGNMMNGNDGDYSEYERTYIHLSQIDQDAIDIQFAEAIMESEMDQLTIQEVVQLVDDIKAGIIEGYNNQTTRTYYGMMGSSSSSNYGCRNSGVYVGSYEWYYMHSYGTERELVDVKFAELLQSSELTNLTVEEVVIVIAEVKEDVLIYLEELRSTIN